MHQNRSTRERGIVLDKDGSPHGGRLETLAKVVFAAMLVINFLSWTNQRAKHDIVSTPQGDAAALRKAEAVFAAFNSKGSSWTIEDLVKVRNTLTTIRDAEDGHGPDVNTRINALVKASVGKTLDELNSAAAASTTVKERIVTQGRVEKVRSELFSRPPYRPVIGGGFGHFAWAVVRLIGKTYLLFMPFALLCFLTRIARNRLSLREELLFGLRRLVVSTIFWPAGMSEYPRDTAIVLRRQKIAMEYLVRHGRSVWDALNEMDQRAIDRLVMQPLDELRQSLDAIRELPFRLVLKARLAFCASVFAGFLLSVVTFGRGTAYAAENATVTDAAAQVLPAQHVPKTISVTGFGSVLANTGGGMSLERLFIIGNAEPAPGLSVNVIGKVASTAQINQAIVVALLGQHGIRVGQLFVPAGYHVPAPGKERIIGGPGVENIMHFIDVGGTVFGEYGHWAWTLGIVSGAGANKPDNNSAKDLVIGFEARNLGPLSLKLTAQGGEQQNGTAIYTSGVASLKLGTVDLVVNAARNKVAGGVSDGVSSFIGWRATPYLDLAAQHDSIRSATSYCRAAFQATVIGWQEKLSLGLLGFKHSLFGFGAQARLQFSF